jgi:hypothetical protein
VGWDANASDPIGIPQADGSGNVLLVEGYHRFMALGFLKYIFTGTTYPAVVEVCGASLEKEIAYFKQYFANKDIKLDPIQLPESWSVSLLSPTAKWEDVQRYFPLIFSTRYSILLTHKNTGTLLQNKLQTTRCVQKVFGTF